MKGARLRIGSYQWTRDVAFDAPALQTRAMSSTRGPLPRVVIVGAGFGGIAAVKALADEPVAITIVDRNNFHTFSPLLYQVATSGLAPDDIAPNVRGIVRRYPNVEAHMGTVLSVDF